jgi:hypothetical protein
MKTQIKNCLKKNMLGTCAALLAVFLLEAGSLSAQKSYDDFEGNAVVTYHTIKPSVMDSTASNPSPDAVNSSRRCAMYIRGNHRYDNIKISPVGRLTGVEKYATYEGEPPAIKMKVYTTAPVGSLVEVQLGKKTGNAYPQGTNSQFQARTTKSGHWEELEFKFAITPAGSQTSFADVDQITLLFNPGSNSEFTWYFDDLTGPSLSPVAAIPKPGSKLTAREINIQARTRKK